MIGRAIPSSQAGRGLTRLGRWGLRGEGHRGRGDQHWRRQHVDVRLRARLLLARKHPLQPLPRAWSGFACEATRHFVSSALL